MDSIRSIALGESHGLALLKDGTVQGWGDTTFGKIRIPNGLKEVASIHAGGNQSAVILQDGRIIRWGDTSATLPTSELRVRKLSLGYQHLLMIDSSRTLLGSGSNRFGETQTPVAYGPIADISTGATISMLRESGDTVRVWGRIKVLGTYIRGVKDMAAGAVHALALSSEGKIYGWGENYYGQTFVPNEIDEISQISAGLYNSVALVKSPAHSVSSRKAPPHTSVLPPGEYQVSVVNVNGVQIWEGRSEWNGRAWILPRLGSSVGFILVQGSLRGSSIHP
jgi:alpha-tubulin suppressor-like RCC1 family protein